MKEKEITYIESMINWSFIEVGSEGFVVGLRPEISKVVKFVESDGKQLVVNGKPKWGIYSHNVTKVFSRKEKEEMIKMMRTND